MFLDFIKEGKSIALVSDAGTPLICDPGAVIVEELRKHDISITSLAGPNAVITFLSQLSREDEEFTFIGFMPKTDSQIKSIAEKYKFSDMVFYESPNRILKTLDIISEVRPDSKVAVGRELTKVFEEVIVDDIQTVLKHLSENTVKGEFVVMLYRDKTENSVSDLDEKIILLKNKNFKAKEISTILSELYKVNKNAVYKRVLELL